MPVPRPTYGQNFNKEPTVTGPYARIRLSFFPERERYTRTWGPFLESTGVTLVLGALVTLWAYRTWPAGLNEIFLALLSLEFLWDPWLLPGIFVLSFVPSLIWLVLHPLIDARRIDRSPELEYQIDRHYSMLFRQAFGMHAIAFMAAAGTGVFFLDTVSPSMRMPLTLGIYDLVHGTVHCLWNRCGSVFLRQSNLNLQSHLYGLLMTDPSRFQANLRLLGAVSAFQNSMSSRIGLILDGEAHVCPEEVLKGLGILIRTFPPKGGLETILKQCAPDKTSEYRPIIDRLLAVIHSRTPIFSGAPTELNIPRLLATGERGRPIRVLCACIRNYNRSPAMETALRFLIEQKGLERVVLVSSGGIAPLQKPNHQLAAVLRAKGMSTAPHRPRLISDDDLRNAHLILAADVPTALTLILRLKRLEVSPGVPEKIILFTALDRSRFKGRDNLPDPYYDLVSIGDMLEQVYEVLERELLPSLEAATIPPSLVALAGHLLRGFLPGDLPPYQVEKRMRLLLAIARNDPTYLIHIDRRKYRARELSPNDVKFLWDDYKLFNESFLAQLNIRFAERRQLLSRSPYAKDYSNSVVALHSLLSPVIHQLAKSRQVVLDRSRG